MNAFLEVLVQLVAAVDPVIWKEQRYFSFNSIINPVGKVFDACIFRQNASGALGILWIKFEDVEDLLTFPFRLARYQEDGDLISLSPWSLREASVDVEFFEAWRTVFSHKKVLLTELGASFGIKNFSSKPNLLALGIQADAKSTLVRLEYTEAIKIFRNCSKDKQSSIEVEILEYLNHQTIFLGFANLLALFEYSSKLFAKNIVAITLKYIRNDGAIWHDYLARLHSARFLQKDQEIINQVAKDDVLKMSESLGRLAGEFHRAMAHARENPNLIPEPNTGDNRKNWLEMVGSVIDDRIRDVATIGNKYQEFSCTINSLNKIKDLLTERVNLIENLGIKIRIHGRMHLGHVLNGNDGLFLFDFGIDLNDDAIIIKQKSSALKDLAALLLSFRYAWFTTAMRHFSPVIRELLFETGENDNRNSEDNKVINDYPNYNITLAEIENAALRAYLGAISEDAAGQELVPRDPGEFKNLYNLMFFMRILRELKKDFQIGNPRCKTSLRILEEFCTDIVAERDI